MNCHRSKEILKLAKKYQCRSKTRNEWKITVTGVFVCWLFLKCCELRYNVLSISQSSRVFRFLTRWGGDAGRLSTVWKGPLSGIFFRSPGTSGSPGSSGSPGNSGKSKRIFEIAGFPLNSGQLVSLALGRNKWYLRTGSGPNPQGPPGPLTFFRFVRWKHRPCTQVRKKKKGNKYLLWW